jgi:hypothetical protein
MTSWRVRSAICGECENLFGFGWVVMAVDPWCKVVALMRETRGVDQVLDEDQGWKMVMGCFWWFLVGSSC